MKRNLASVLFAACAACCASIANAEATATSMAITFSPNPGSEFSTPGMSFTGMAPNALSVSSASGFAAAASASADGQTGMVRTGAAATDAQGVNVVAPMPNTGDQGRDPLSPAITAHGDITDAYTTTIVLRQ